MGLPSTSGFGFSMRKEKISVGFKPPNPFVWVSLGKQAAYAHWVQSRTGPHIFFSMLGHLLQGIKPAPLVNLNNPNTSRKNSRESEPNRRSGDLVMETKGALFSNGSTLGVCREHRGRALSLWRMLICWPPSRRLWCLSCEETPWP